MRHRADSRQHLIYGTTMTATTSDTESGSTWRRTQRFVEFVRDWLANGNSPYSPLFCVSLLLGIGLIIEIGR
jgi:hypothetical protein